MPIISFLVGNIFSALHFLHLASAVPQPFPDRLATLDPSSSSLDNEIYNQQSFDWSKSGLHLLNPVRVGYFLDKLDRHVSSLSPGSGKKVVILDLGCGAGIAIEALYSALLSRSGTRASSPGIVDEPKGMTYKLVGLDMSSRSINQARQQAKEKDTRIEYIVGDIYSPPLPEGSVDAIICSDVVEHLFDLPAAFSAISKILKPEGLFSFDTINRTPTSYYLTIWILQVILKAMQGDAHDHRLYVTPEEVEKAMEGAGLKPGPKKDLVGMRPGVVFPPVGLWRLMTGRGFVSSMLGEFRLTNDLGISYLHWCQKPQS